MQTLGESQLVISVEASGIERGLAVARRSLAGFGAAAQAELDKLPASAKKAAENLSLSISKYELAGKAIDSAKEKLLAFAIGTKTSGAVQQELIDRLTAVTTALRNQESAVSAGAKASEAEAKAAELQNVALERQAAIRDRLAAFLATPRGQKALESDGITPAKARAIELENAALERQAAIRERLATLLATPRGQKIVEAQGTTSAEARAAELENAALERQAAIRDRLAALLSTSRGQKILEAQATERATVATLRNAQATTIAGNAATKAFSGTNKSARELNFALRNLPAQVTDIAVSLAGGQPPLTVLLQQGGQLKDMFGGVGAAARAIGSSILAMINPLTIAVAAAAGLALAFNDAQAQQAALARSIALTGNASNATVEQLSALAAKLDDTTVGTQRLASEAIAAANATGRFTLSELEAVATAAIELKKRADTSIEDTISKFVRIKDDPEAELKALLKTGKQLDEATLKQAEGFIRLGDKAGLASLLVRQLSDNSVKAAQQIEQSATSAGRAFSGIGRAASEAVDLIVADTGRAADAVTDFAKKLPLFSDPSGLSQAGALLRVLDAFDKKSKSIKPPQFVDQEESLRRIAASEKEKEAEKTAAEERKRFIKETDQLQAGLLSKEAKLRKDIEDIQAEGIKLGLSDLEIQRRINALKETAKKSETSRVSTQRASDFAAINDRISAQIALNKEQIAGQDKLSTSETLAVRIREELKSSTTNLSTSERALIEAQLERLKITGAQVEADKKRLAAQQALERLSAQIADRESTSDKANQAEIDAVGKGDAFLEREQRKQKILEDFDSKVSDLNKNRVAGDQELYNSQVQLLSASRDRMLAKESEFQASLSAARANWQNGLTASISNYVSEAENIAAQTQAIFDNAFTGLEDLATDFFTKGKADWRGYLDSILADITKFIVKQQLSNFLKSGLGALGSLFGGATPSANGNAFTGSGMVTAFANGGVVGSATPFKFGGGKLGVMGEDGPEGILPLKRDSKGKLGVVSVGGSGAVTNVTNFVLPESVTRKTQAQIAQRQQSALNNARRYA